MRGARPQWINGARAWKDGGEVICMPGGINRSDMPIGLGMAFAENVDAMRHFSAMPDSEQKAVVDGARDVKSRDEMRAYVRSLVP